MFQEWNFSAEVLLYSGTIRHFFSASCSLIFLFFSLFLARSQALELEHLSRESEESATRYGLERANLLLHSPPVSSLAFYNAFLPVFARLHFCTRAHIALARVFLENRGLLLWGRPTDGLRNRRCSLTVCRGASAAPPSRLVLPPCCPPCLFRPCPSIPLYPPPPASVFSCVFCVSPLLSLALARTPRKYSSHRVSTDFSSRSPIFRIFSFESNAESFSHAIAMFPKKKKEREKKQYNLRSDEKEREGE